MYRMEIYTRWKRRVKTEVSCESDNIEEILFWFRDNWYIGVKKVLVISIYTKMAIN